MKRTVVVFAVVVGVSAVTGCGSAADPVPVTPVVTVSAKAPTPIPTPTALTAEQVAEEVKQANIAAAQQTLIDYYAKGSEVANNHFQGWEELQRYWGTPEIIDIQTQVSLQSINAGIYTTGATRLATLEVTDYVFDDRYPGFEQVSFRGCLDTTAVTGYNADGTEIPKSTTISDRTYVDYMLQQQGVGAGWTINTEDQHLDQPC